MEAAAREREFEFTDRDFREIRELVRKLTGIALSDAKSDLVYGRLARRLRKLGLARFSEYLALVRQPDSAELRDFVNSITTNTTSFFRESPQFDALEGEILPEMMRRNAGERRLRIWSAGCSTGQEPYTIGMVVLPLLPAAQGWDFKILATDLDSAVLATARAGVYPEGHVESVPAPLRSTWFQRGAGPNAGLLRVKAELRDRITFNQLNLMDAWPMKGSFDAIFFRNVAIYFDRPTQTELVRRFAERLAPRGWLFIGHSETLLDCAGIVEPCGRGIYRRCA